MSKFGRSEQNAAASGRPLCLFGKEFIPTIFSIKECIFKAIPRFPRDIADLIDETVKQHVQHDVEARELVKTCNLTSLEAESLVWWSVDVSTLSSNMNTEDSPYYVYNAALRSRDGPSIRNWQDYSYYMVNALDKLPPIETICYRGESKKVTELSRQYAKGNQVFLRKDILVILE